MSIENLFKAIIDVSKVGPFQALVDIEKREGYDLIPPGSVSWLPRNVWRDDVVITRNGDIVRIVGIYQVHPGKGHFSRLITGIIQAGYIPHVMIPSRTMQQILVRWGWHCQQFETWVPSQSFIEKRKEMKHADS